MMIVRQYNIQVLLTFCETRTNLSPVNLEDFSFIKFSEHQDIFCRLDGIFQ